MNIMNKIGLALLLSVILLISTMTTIAMASGWQQFRTDEANAGIAADSAPVAAPDGMMICDAQLALQLGGA